jgi:hypothetical protein
MQGGFNCFPSIYESFEAPTIRIEVMRRAQNHDEGKMTASGDHCSTYAQNVFTFCAEKKKLNDEAW